MSTSREPEQYCLFEIGWNIAKLREKKEQLMRHAKAPNTLKAYRESWNVFETWCRKIGYSALPASPETVSLFLTWGAEAEQQYKAVTLQLSLAAIRHYHLAAGMVSPVNHEVRKVISGIRRSRARREGRAEKAGKRHISVELLQAISGELMKTFDPLDIRDRAMILLLFAAGWRRSEIAALRDCDALFVSRGVLLGQGFSKEDQEGEGGETAIPYGEHELTCPVRALKAWIKVRGEWSGPLFVRFRRVNGVPAPLMVRAPLSGEAICDAVKRAVRRVGYNPDHYGAHSCRSGMITAASENGADIRAIMDYSRHKSPVSVLRYIKSAQAFRANPLRGVL